MISRRRAGARQRREEASAERRPLSPSTLAGTRRTALPATPQPIATAAGTTAADLLLLLHRTLGNRAVAGLVAGGAPLPGVARWPATALRETATQVDPGRLLPSRGAIELLQRTRDGSPGAVPWLQRAPSKAPAHRTLKAGIPFGSEGPDVEDLQTRINDDSATAALDVDGKFGPLTKKAVQAFQRRHGLDPDGVAGKQTWGVLDAMQDAGIAGPTDALAGTHTVSEEEHNKVEQALHPTTPPGKESPPMTGAGKGKEFETEMIAALDAFVGPLFNPEMEKPSAGIADTKDLARAAQKATEAFFANYLVMASREPTGAYHPGSFTIPLKDASSRAVDITDAMGWVQYFMREPTFDASKVLTAHSVDVSRPKPDAAEFNRVRDVFAQTRFAKVRNVVRGWPAEAGSGTVFVQPRKFTDRAGKWRLFQTMIHEFLHLCTHPNHNRVAEAVGGSAFQVLIEGLTDHFTLEVWANVKPTLEGDVELRKTVEGTFFEETPDPKAFSDPSTYDQTGPNKIVSAVGEENVRAAYFAGHDELLGLGKGSKSVAPLKGIAGWTTSDSAEAGVYTVRPGGETVAQVRDRTASMQVAELDGTVWVDPGQHFDAGHKLKVEGIRWHRAIAEDTRAQVANQSGVTQEQLEKANSWSHAKGDKRVPAGTLVLIPNH